MRELELIGTIGVIAFCMLVAALFTSENVRRDKITYQNFKAVFGIVLSGFASFGIVIILDQYYLVSESFILFILFLTIWEAQGIIAAYIGFTQRKIDFKKRYNIN